ncbi:hypothetical protein N1031_05345 [Herbiconiux moechotypicola]|uniref:Uncharacterized protein n=1 Tax=Herbiconiux moechotypicola TaxID=637393 RepID=A0ABN3DDM9_9MICO|nr:hypothetical protein [Herbiconiux moechotypicola]MCS5729180.1 hypothetical protein [Herbiconiux moechotypicola]
MSDVWVVLNGDGDGESASSASRELVELLLAQRHQVAVISPDVEPFALLVNRYADAVVTAELREPDLLALNEAVWSIDENFGAVDVIAFVGQPADAERARLATEFFAGRWPDADIVVAPTPLPADCGR